MPLGVLFALLSYSLYSCGDALVKSFSGQLSVFEIGFFGNLFALLPAVFAKRPGEHWHYAFHLAHPRLLHVRGVVAVISSVAITYSFTTIPLAEAYSIAFLTPLFLTVLSVLVLKERVTVDRWLLVGLSFVGVMIVVRPGFRELHAGHLTALIAAFASAASTTILRIVSGKEQRLSIVAMNGLYQVVGNGVLMVAVGFVLLPPLDMLRLACIGLFGGTAQLIVIAALKMAPASHVGPAQYVQIVWAVIFGSVFYHEFPDSTGVVGLVVVVLAGVMTVFSDGARTRIAGRWSEFRARHGGPKFTEVEPPEV
jgi:drug/metabolite transporter (DMT)-like permease